MAANPERGEVEITLDGKTYPMRPSFEAMQRIEHQTGRQLMRMVMDFRDHGLSLTECSVIVAEGIKAAGRDRDDKLMQSVKTDKIGEMIYENGIMEAVPACMEFLMNALNGGKAPKKKEAEGAET